MQVEWQELETYLREIYRGNPYVLWLGMQIERLAPKEVTLRLPIEPDQHTNLYRVAHGGAIASLADTAMGMACATTGSKVVTLDLNVNFIKAAPGGEALTAVGRVLHAGRSTMVAECDIQTGSGVRVALGRGTFFVTGRFVPGEPVV